MAVLECAGRQDLVSAGPPSFGTWNVEPSTQLGHHGRERKTWLWLVYPMDASSVVTSRNESRYEDSGKSMYPLYMTEVWWHLKYIWNLSPGNSCQFLLSTYSVPSHMRCSGDDGEYRYLRYGTCLKGYNARGRTQIYMWLTASVRPCGAEVTRIHRPGNSLRAGGGVKIGSQDLADAWNGEG